MTERDSLGRFKKGLIPHNHIEIEYELLIALHYGNQLTISKIGNLLNCDKGVISRKFKLYGISYYDKLSKDVLIEPELLFQLYHGNCYSTDEIAKMFRVATGTIKQKMKKFNISMRTHSDAMKNRPEEIYIGTSEKQKGKHHSPKTEFKKGEHCGENHPNWLGGKSFEEYTKDFNIKLKEKIRKRDNFTCQECGYTEEQLGYRLPIHHIDYNKKNNSIENLVSLCKSCHCKTNFNRNDWIVYYKNKGR